MRQNRVHLMPPMSNFYARICVKATPSSNSQTMLSPESPLNNNLPVSCLIFLPTTMREEP